MRLNRSVGRRFNLLKTITDEGIDIQSKEDISPVKMSIMGRDYEKLVDQIKEWHKNAQELLNRLGYYDLKSQFEIAKVLSRDFYSLF